LARFPEKFLDEKWIASFGGEKLNFSLNIFDLLGRIRSTWTIPEGEGPVYGKRNY
jgi:hypothetical protein